MDDEVKINSLKFCLNCDCWKMMKIGMDGWWRPNCEHWNPAKSTKEMPYGPKTGCRFVLEHSLLDNRRGFRLVSAECFIPLVEFVDRNVKWCSESDNRFIVVLYTNPIPNPRGKSQQTLYIKRNASKDEETLIVEDVLKMSNAVLKDMGESKLTHNNKYEYIFRKDNGKWASGLIEER